VKPETLLELPEDLPPRLREYVTPFTTERGRSWLWWAVGVLGFFSFLAFLAAGANQPLNPVLGAPSTTTTLPPPRASRIAGFNEVYFVVQQFPGLRGVDRKFCGVHAETPEQQTKGLMGRPDLAGYDAMIFSFPADVAQSFHMRGVTIPLTIAFFDSSGRFLGSVDMPPCPARIRRCPTHALGGNPKFRFAMEVQQGGLGRLGIGPGATVTPGGGCP
jgi:uncharacterized membrane protein (UPF0127 family)